MKELRCHRSHMPGQLTRSSIPHYRSPDLETIWQSLCRRHVMPRLTSEAGSRLRGARGNCCVWRPGHVWSGFQIIVHVWCTHERVLNTICRFESGDDPAERTAWTREISATAAETRKGSLKMLALLGSGWPWPALLSSHLSSDSQLQRSQIANSSQSHLASSPVTQLTSSQKQEKIKQFINFINRFVF